MKLFAHPNCQWSWFGSSKTDRCGNFVHLQDFTGLGCELQPSRQPRIFERFGWVQRPGASLGPKLQEISTKWGFPHLRWSSNCPVCRCEGSGSVSEMWSKVKSEAKNELGIPYTSYHGIPMLNQCQPARDTRHAQHASFPRLVFFCPDGRFHFYSHTQTITRRCLDADAWWILEVLGAHGRIWKAGKSTCDGSMWILWMFSPIVPGMLETGGHYIQFIYNFVFVLVHLI